jgi:hypothetical protein
MHKAVEILCSILFVISVAVGYLWYVTPNPRDLENK